MRTVIAVTLLAAVALAQTDLNRFEPDGRTPKNTQPRDILLADHIHGHWLTIGRNNHTQPGGEFNPNWTYIKLEAPVKPIVRKRGDRYEITFTSALTEDLP
jgi:hypothetical protein